MAFAEAGAISGLAGLLAGLTVIAGVGLTGKIGVGNKGLLDLISDDSVVGTAEVLCLLDNTMAGMEQFW